MTDDELRSLDAHQALTLLRAGKLGAQEYTNALLRGMQVDAGLHAMIHVDPESVRAAAQKADKTPAKDRGLLHGLPLVVKDNIDVAGLPCTAGSPALASHRPLRDADCVTPLRAAGALVLGKSNLHELALGVTSRNRAYGAVGNPYAPERIAGGSSGGTAAAIAAGMAPVGLGTDTGGSIRIPAGLCGVVGFRPSTGRWPSRGVVPISVPTRDTAVPMARSVADCALLDAVVCDEDPKLLALSPPGLRLGVPCEFWTGLHDGLAAQMDEALKALSAAHVHLVPMSLNIDLSAVGKLGLTVAMAENLPALRAYFADHDLPFDPERLAADIASPDVRALFRHLTTGGTPDQTTYTRALNEIRVHLQPAWAHAFTHHRVDALVMPTTPLPAARVDEEESIHMRGRCWPTFDTYVRHCTPATLLGLPSITLPSGCTQEGGSWLPVGLMLDGPMGADRRLLSIAAALHRLLPPTPLPR